MGDSVPSRLLTFDGLGAHSILSFVTLLASNLSAVSHSRRALSEGAKDLAFVKALLITQEPYQLVLVFVLFISRFNLLKCQEVGSHDETVFP